MSNAIHTAAAEREMTAALRVLASNLLAQARRETFNLAALGQKVYLAADLAKKYNISQGPYTVAKTKGEGDDQFADLAELRGVGGEPWPMRSIDFVAAPAVHGQSPLEGTPTTKIREDQMAVNAAADRFEAAVDARVARGERQGDAIRAQGLIDDEGAKAYRLRPLGTIVPAEPAGPTFTLSADLEAKAENGATFDQLVSQFAVETRCDLRHAIHVVGARFPELAQSR
jgi:hypothetical protein